MEIIFAWFGRSLPFLKTKILWKGLKTIFFISRLAISLTIFDPTIQTHLWARKSFSFPRGKIKGQIVQEKFPFSILHKELTPLILYAHFQKEYANSVFRNLGLKNGVCSKKTESVNKVEKLKHGHKKVSLFSSKNVHQLLKQEGSVICVMRIMFRPRSSTFLT